MQRWIALGVLAFVLVCGGGFYGYKAYKASRPGPIWVPLTINAELDKPQRDEACAKLKDYLTEEQRLLSIVRDLQLSRVWALPSDDAAAAELKKRVFVRTGSVTTPMGDASCINVGLNGTQKEKPMTEKIVMRMMDDVKGATGGPSSGRSNEAARGYAPNR